ncbi:MAG: SDR family oxidoreductase [Leptospiraceae bacterium]|nr:SDR family oxidoreductase [Leptospiraceae bacterium]
MKPVNVLVTGASGYLGRQVVAGLATLRRKKKIGVIVAADVRPVSDADRLTGVTYAVSDIREPGLEFVLKKNRVHTVVHLASIVTPGKKSDRNFEYSVDVEGTRNVLDACVKAGVRHIVISSSGAAYGYHPDNAEWLSETDPVRGNYEFAYSWHKRLVEEMLVEYRQRHKTLKQTIFRIGTILGATVRNQITDLFEKPRLIAIRGSRSPFVFIWDQDVVGVMLRAIVSGKAGIYNVAGDGALSIREIAQRLGKRVVNLPPSLLRAALWLLKRLRLTQYGPEQINFLRYRPVLANRRLKEEFGYVPQKTSAEVFEFWKASRAGGRQEKVTLPNTTAKHRVG